MKPSRSLASIVVFCASSALIAALGLAVVFATVSAAFGVARSLNDTENGQTQQAAEQNDSAVRPVDTANAIVASGLITDNHCGARHNMNSGKNSTDCVQECVRQGSGYMLVNGDRRYQLAGDADLLSRFAGQRAGVSGSLTGRTIRVASVWATD